MKIRANEIKLGNVIIHAGDLWRVIKNPEHTQPGKGGAYVQVEMKSLKNGTKLNHRFSSTNTVDKAFLEHKKVEYLYNSGDELVFMCQDSFEQIFVDKNLLGAKYGLLQDNMTVDLELHQNEVLGVIFPNTVELTISSTEPVIKHSTITSSYKPAVTDSGLNVMVPQYMKDGEKIVIKTSDMSFVSRAK